MPNLDGFLIVAKDVPSFVIPVLIDRPGSNRSLIQQIDGSNRIASFFEVDVGNNYEGTPFKFEFDVGDKALWGFRSLNGEISFGDLASLKEEMESRLFANEFTNFPLIESQIAKFFDLSGSYASALSKSYQTMLSRSKLAATIWRDCIVLLPLAKKDLAQLLPKYLRSELDNIRLVGTGSKILLKLPQRVHDFLKSEVTDLKLTGTLAIGNALGLTSYSIEGTEAKARSSVPEATFDEPYGELVPFTGIGDMAAKNGLSYRRIRRLVPPWISNDSRPATKLPLVTFCVVNTDLEKIDKAIQFITDHVDETIKIAIVTSPITFGTSRGHKLNPRLLDSLRPAFDYVFVIGNHILQMPTGAAPRLAASSRAVTYVRACVGGIMELIWSAGAPTTPNEFFATFPRDGFGLIGRASGKKDTRPEEILEKAIESALNERLRLQHSRRLVLIGPPSIVDNSNILSFLDRAADTTLNQTLSVVSTNRRAAVTLLGFGIRLGDQDEHEHRQFCLELLHTRNFSIHRESKGFVRGEFIGGTAAVIGFSASERSLVGTGASVEATSTKTRCVLTNFTPSPLGVEHYWNRGIAVFHYSLLDTYLAGRMSSPPLRRWQ
jgi:hypothetical protein